MAEYIEREKAIDFVKQYTPHIDGETTMQCVKTALENVPSANVVKVVRCKDCGYCELCYPVKEIGKEAIEGYFCYLNQKYIKATDFCSYGELKGLGK